MMETTLTAFATTSGNTIGADAGISIFRQVVEDGVLRESTETETIPAAGTLADDGDLDYDEAEKMLADAGYKLAGAWTESGGQFAAQVEKA